MKLNTNTKKARKKWTDQEAHANALNRREREHIGPTWKYFIISPEVWPASMQQFFVSKLRKWVLKQNCFLIHFYLKYFCFSDSSFGCCFFFKHKTDYTIVISWATTLSCWELPALSFKGWPTSKLSTPVFPGESQEGPHSSLLVELLFLLGFFPNNGLF